MQTEAFQGCQAHNSFVCYAIETSCSLLSQYLLPNGMCALLQLLLNNTRFEEGLITSLLCLSPLSSCAPLRPSLPFLYLTYPAALSVTSFIHQLGFCYSLPPYFLPFSANLLNPHLLGRATSKAVETHCMALRGSYERNDSSGQSVYAAPFPTKAMEVTEGEMAQR